MQYDRLAVNTVVATRDGGIATCDIHISADLEQFNQDYLKLTGQIRESGESYELGEDYMVIGTSALAGYEIDGAVNIYAGCYNNPFLIWGKYRKKWLRTTRTLRWYDQIGLLKPSRVAESGYRYYGGAEVDRLQDILYYRALGVELVRIKECLDDPSFDRLAAL